MQINALAAMKRGAQLTPWEYAMDRLGAHECLIKVHACGICHSDLHMVDDDWRASTYPLVPGHEVIGEVLETGSAVTHLKPGTRVGVGWQRAACLECADCVRGDENLCDQNQSVISGHGGFAEHVVVDSRFAFRIPAGIETTHGGPLLCGGITVYSALRHAGMTSGQHIGVIGIGGLGHLAVQFASKLGNRVTAFTSSADKAELATALGAHEVVLTGEGAGSAPSRPLDILLTTAFVNLEWDSYLSMLASDGTLSIVGALTEPMRISSFPLMLKRRKITGSVIGGRAMISDMLRIADEFGVQPVVETFPMQEANRALDKVRRNAIRYRAVLLNS